MGVSAPEQRNQSFRFERTLRFSPRFERSTHMYRVASKSYFRQSLYSLFVQVVIALIAGPFLGASFCARRRSMVAKLIHHDVDGHTHFSNNILDEFELTSSAVPPHLTLWYESSLP